MSDKPRALTHLLQITYSLTGHEYRRAICERLDHTCDDGSDLTDNEAEVTCAFCLSLLKAPEYDPRPADGAWLYRRRKAAGLTQRELADALGTSGPIICAIELGRWPLNPDWMPIIFRVLGDDRN